MAPHSSTLAWKIPWMEEPGGLQCMGSRRVGHDWTTSLSLVTFMHWRRKWQPTPVLLPGESQGQGSLVGCHLWGRTEWLSSSSSSMWASEDESPDVCIGSGWGWRLECHRLTWVPLLNQMSKPHGYGKGTFDAEVTVFQLSRFWPLGLK